jgi:LEA14-like dessication related protein
MKSLGFLLVVFVTASCAAFGKPLEKPDVDVTAVGISSVSLRGVDGRVDLAVTNPNSVGLPLRAIDWQLEVGGARAVTGRSELAQTIPAKGSAPVATDLHIGSLDAADVAARLAAGDRSYRFSATLHFSTSLGDLSVTVVDDGELASL